jgi:hypothetical protein
VPVTGVEGVAVSGLEMGFVGVDGRMRLDIADNIWCGRAQGELYCETAWGLSANVQYSGCQQSKYAGDFLLVRAVCSRELGRYWLV